MKTLILFSLFTVLSFGQATTPTTTSTNAAVVSPTYFSDTGARYSYYDKTLTETTNLGVHVTGAQSTAAPHGFWATVSVDATPRSQASSAGLRFGGRYYLSSVAGGDIIAYANVAAGAVTTTSTASGNSALLGNLQGGVGFVWRACHTFNKASKVNCIVDLDYELNAVTTQSTKPVIGLYVGLAF